MDTLKKVIKSRTTYTVLALVAINVIPVIKDAIPAYLQPFADSLLGLAIIYFKHNPSQEYAPLQK